MKAQNEDPVTEYFDDRAEQANKLSATIELSKNLIAAQQSRGGDSKWIVDVKKASDETCEISVLREDDTFGRKSWGWYDADTKIVIAPNHKFTPRVLAGLLSLANEIAIEMNIQRAAT